MVRVRVHHVQKKEFSLGAGSGFEFGVSEIGLRIPSLGSGV